MEIALLYRSKLAKPGFDGDFRAALAAHLAASGPHNAALNVSGFLLIADGYLYELLEGEFAAVSGVFAQMLASPLVSEVEMLSNATISRRVCHGWAHARVAEDDATPADLAAKVQMLHHFATRFGGSQPVLRDFIARIGQDIAAPRVPLRQVMTTRYALAS